VIFKPIDENSLRHLFSTKYAQELLHLSYLGPVLNCSGQAESSPDGMILDMRKHPFRSWRCEFKFIPQDKGEFSHNGKFDIAIIWALPNGLSKAQLNNALLEQNGCFELIVLDQMKAFHDLPVYTLDSLSRVTKFGGDIIKNLAIRRRLPSVIALYMAARLAQQGQGFKLDRMVNFLSNRFQEVAKMLPQGRANIVSAFIQTAPPLLEYMHGRTYRWINDFDSELAAQVLAELITVNFQSQVPAKQDLDLVI
jgi:hypothetical protein